MHIKLKHADLTKISCDKFWSFAIVLNFMLATYFRISNWILTPLLCLSIYYFIKNVNKDKRLFFLGILTLFSCFSFFLFKVDFNNIVTIDDLVPISLFTLLVFSLGASEVINLKVIKLFCLFFIFEVIIASFLFISGNQTIYELFHNLQDLNGYEWKLQLNGVNGLSDSSTSLGLNSFLLLILLQQYFKKDKLIFVLTIIGSIGVLLSGSKYMIFLLIPFLFYNFYLVKKLSLTHSIFLITLGIIFFLSVLVGLTSLSYVNDLMSERIRIGYRFFDFIKDNIYLGNHSQQHRYFNSNGKSFHAHNSIIQLIANHGIVYSTLVLGLVISQLNKANISSILFFFLLSICNHILFWGFYHVDLIFAFILFHNYKYSS